MITEMNCIINDMIGFPVDASTKDFLDKFILVIIGPALINEVEHAVKPVENNCQNPIPSKAYIGYGIARSPILNIPDSLNNINVATLTTGLNNNQKIPINDCLYAVTNSRLNN